MRKKEGYAKVLFLLIGLCHFTQCHRIKSIPIESEANGEADRRPSPG